MIKKTQVKIGGKFPALETCLSRRGHPCIAIGDVLVSLMTGDAFCFGRDKFPSDLVPVDVEEALQAVIENQSQEGMYHGRVMQWKMPVSKEFAVTTVEKLEAVVKRVLSKKVMEPRGIVPSGKRRKGG